MTFAGSLSMNADHSSFATNPGTFSERQRRVRLDLLISLCLSQQRLDVGQGIDLDDAGQLCVGEDQPEALGDATSGFSHLRPQRQQRIVQFLRRDVLNRPIQDVRGNVLFDAVDPLLAVFAGPVRFDLRFVVCAADPTKRLVLALRLGLLRLLFGQPLLPLGLPGLVYGVQRVGAVLHHSPVFGGQLAHVHQPAVAGGAQPVPREPANGPANFTPI